MTIQLSAVDSSAQTQVREIVNFVNQHYRSQLPLEEQSVLSGRVRMFWALSDGGKRVGTTGYIVKTPFLAEAVKTVVASEFRGKGLGAAVSQAIEEEVRQAGYRKLMTTILVDNLPMIFIRLRQGFRFEGFHPDHEQPGLHEYSLGKML